MIFAKISLRYSTDSKEKMYYICSDKLYCGIATDGIEIIDFDIPIAKEVIRAIKEKKRMFNFGEGEYVIIIEYTPLAKWQIDNLINTKDLVRFINLNKPQPIYLYRTYCHCESCKRKFQSNDLEYRRAQVSSISGTPVIIEVQYCKSCGKFFMDYESLKIYESKYGVLIFERKRQSQRGELDDISFADDTVLSRYGYSAGKDCPPDNQRRAILRFLVNNQIATKGELKEILSRFLSYRECRCIYAAPIWQSDLEYLNNYRADGESIFSNFYIKQPIRR